YARRVLGDCRRLDFAPLCLERDRGHLAPELCKAPVCRPHCGPRAGYGSSLLTVLCPALWREANAGVLSHRQQFYLPHYGLVLFGCWLDDGRLAAADRSGLQARTVRIPRLPSHCRVLFLVFPLARFLVSAGSVLQSLLCSR